MADGTQKAYDLYKRAAKFQEPIQYERVQAPAEYKVNTQIPHPIREFDRPTPQQWDAYYANKYRLEGDIPTARFHEKLVDRPSGYVTTRWDNGSEFGNLRDGNWQPRFSDRWDDREAYDFKRYLKTPEGQEWLRRQNDLKQNEAVRQQYKPNMREFSEYVRSNQAPLPSYESVGVAGGLSQLANNPSVRAVAATLPLAYGAYEATRDSQVPLGAMIDYVQTPEYIQARREQMEDMD